MYICEVYLCICVRCVCNCMCVRSRYIYILVYTGIYTLDMCVLSVLGSISIYIYVHSILHIYIHTNTQYTYIYIYIESSMFLLWFEGKLVDMLGVWPYRLWTVSTDILPTLYVYIFI